MYSASVHQAILGPANLPSDTLPHHLASAASRLSVLFKMATALSTRSNVLSAGCRAHRPARVAVRALAQRRDASNTSSTEVVSRRATLSTAAAAILLVANNKKAFAEPACEVLTSPTTGASAACYTQAGTNRPLHRLMFKPPMHTGLQWCETEEGTGPSPVKGALIRCAARACCSMNQVGSAGATYAHQRSSAAAATYHGTAFSGVKLTSTPQAAKHLFLWHTQLPSARLRPSLQYFSLQVHDHTNLNLLFSRAPAQGALHRPPGQQRPRVRQLLRARPPSHLPHRCRRGHSVRAAGNGSALFSGDPGPKGPADCLVQDRGCTRRGDEVAAQRHLAEVVVAARESWGKEFDLSYDVSSSVNCTVCLVNTVHHDA